MLVFTRPLTLGWPGRIFFLEEVCCEGFEIFVIGITWSDDALEVREVEGVRVVFRVAGVDGVRVVFRVAEVDGVRTPVFVMDFEGVGFLLTVTMVVSVEDDLVEFEEAGGVSVEIFRTLTPHSGQNARIELFEVNLCPLEH